MPHRGAFGADVALDPYVNMGHCFERGSAFSGEAAIVRFPSLQLVVMFELILDGEKISRPIPFRACCSVNSRSMSTGPGTGSAPGLVKHALDDEAAAFWHRRGFLASRDDLLVLFRSITDIAVFLATLSR